MASALIRVRASLSIARASCATRAFASAAVGSHLVSVAPNVSRQKARTWDEGVSSEFSTTSSKTSSRLIRGKKVVIFGLPAKEAIEFYGAVDGKFHKSMELDLDLSDALLGHRSQRWIVDCTKRR